MYSIDFDLGDKTSYKALIGGRLSEFSGEFIRILGGRKALILTDLAIASLHLKKLTEVLDAAGIETKTHIIPAGEKAKNIACFESILSALTDGCFVRGDCLICFGGGSVSDIGGFAASVYKRGMNVVNIPTTLLGMIDSSIGGKNGMDLNAVKNAVGTIHQPRLVLSCTEFLTTLPKREILSGLGEMIKYEAISGKKLLEGAGDVSSRTIAECVGIKREYVVLDAFDAGARHILNLGHTFGHAFEAASSYELSHGEAVALGLAAEARFGAEIGLIPASVEGEITSLIERSGLPSEYKGYCFDASEFIAHDKKSGGETIDMPFVKSFGEPFIEKVPIKSAQDFLRSAAL